MGIKEVFGGLFRLSGRRPVDAKREHVYPKVSLDAECQGQTQRLAGLFAKELGLTEEEYTATLPKFVPQPEQFKGRFDVPIIVETRVPLKRMLELAGIVTYFDVDSIKDWKEGKFATPKTPYTVWVNDGTSNRNKSVKTVRESLKADERGANTHEATALYLKDPKILDKYYLDILGSQVGSGSAPYLARWDGQPELHRHFVAHGDPHYGSVVAGKL